MKLKFTHLLLVLTVVIFAATGLLIQNAHAGQPHMINALDDLRAARHQLEIAEHDKGGYRTQAIATIDQAISQVKAGLDAGD